MSTAQTLQIVSTSIEDTLRIAGQLGTRLHGGEVIELVSDLGGGKTTFVKGVAAGMGSNDVARSPSFTLSNQYKAGELTLHHFDFYRLQEPGIMRDELAEILADPQAVVAVEWADIIDDILPRDHLRVTIAATGDEHREINYQYPPNYAHLFHNNT